MSLQHEAEIIRVRRISPIDTALLFLFFHELLYIVLILTRTVRSEEWSTGLLVVALAAAAAGVVFAFLFNIYGSLVGLRLWTTVDSPIPSAKAKPDNESEHPAGLFTTSQGTSQTKPCPDCQGRVRADRTFCNDCGYDFD